MINWEQQVLNLLTSHKKKNFQPTWFYGFLNVGDNWFLPFSYSTSSWGRLKKFHWAVVDLCLCQRQSVPTYLQGSQYRRPNREGCYTTVTPPLLVATSLKHLRCLLHALLVQVYRLFGRQGEIFRQMVFYIIEKLIRSDLWQVRQRAAHSFPSVQLKSMNGENGKVSWMLTMKRI